MNRIRALNQSDSEHQLDTSISVLTEKTLEVRLNQKKISNHFHKFVAIFDAKHENILFFSVGNQTSI